MEFNIHTQVLLAAFGLAVIMGAVANKTNFCTMGAVSDWVNMDDTGRMRAWLLAMAVALVGVTVLEATKLATVGTATFPPYRTANFAWLRYVLGGLMFGVGMTLGSGCGNKTMVRIGGGNIKSMLVLLVAGGCAYGMLWTDMYDTLFGKMVSATTINLANSGFTTQALGDLLGVGNTITGGVVALLLIAFAFSSKEFRSNGDNIMAGIVIGLIIVGGWYITGGEMGVKWKEFAEFADTKPLRVETQSYTFISAMGDTARYVMNPKDTSLINFGIVALAGVIVGSFLWALISRSFRIESFSSFGDFVNHVFGAVLMGIGGVLSMGCTIGQAITGVSTLAIGSILTFLAIVAGSAATMKYQYWKMMREA
jgi:hypothetical protein